MRISRLIQVAVAVFLGSISFSTAAHAQWLFADSPEAVNLVDRDLAIDPTILRSRLVRIDWGLVNSVQVGVQAQGGGGNALLLNVFQDTTFSAVQDRVEVRAPGNFTWHGHVDGARESQVTLVAVGEVMVGNIRAGERYFQIRYVGNGVHAIRQIDESRFPPEGDPIPINLPSHDGHSLSGSLAMDSAARFDVMVLYTPAARAAGGGTVAMTALVNLAVAETNTAYARSGVIPRVRLVYSGEIVGYAEAGDFSTDLARLQNPSDGFMDNIHTLRNAFGADLVSLIIEGDGSLCGIGYLMTTLSAGFEAFAFSVSARNCATGNYTFSHEMGHNMGLQHDRINEPANGVFPHSHGYVDVTHNFRDIMGVATGCGGCPRIQNFSNPNVTFNGFPTGVSQAAANSADAAASLNATALTVANWRTQVVPGDFGGDGKSDIAIFRNGIWYDIRSSDGLLESVGLGTSGDVPVAADYDGDGKTDRAIFRNGAWYYFQSSNGALAQVGLGTTGDVPVPADYDGDGKADPAIFRDGIWYIRQSSNGVLNVVGLGMAGDVPVPADYDGDRKADPAIVRNGTWYIRQSSDGALNAVGLGTAGDIVVPADYDGDGKTDQAVFRNGLWFILQSSNGVLNTVGLGTTGDVPVPADYDGDGKTDQAVFRNGLWFILQSSNGVLNTVGLGTTGDVPIN